MRPGEKVKHRNAHGVEARLVGWTVAIAFRGHVEFGRRRRTRDDIGPLRGRFASEDHEFVVAHHSDHVEIDHRHDAIDRDRRMRDEVRRSAEACLFRREQGDESRDEK